MELKQFCKVTVKIDQASVAAFFACVDVIAIQDIDALDSAIFGFIVTHA